MPREIVTVQIGQCGTQIGTQFWHLALQEHATAQQQQQQQQSSHVYAPSRRFRSSSSSSSTSDGADDADDASASGAAAGRRGGSRRRATPHQPRYDEPLSTFFRHVDARGQPLDQRSQRSSTLTPTSSSSLSLAPPPALASLKARAVIVDMESGPLTSLLASPLGSLFDTNTTVLDTHGAGSGSGNNFAHGHYEYGPKYHDILLDTMHRAIEPCDSLQAFMFMHSLGGGTGSGLGTYTLRLCADAFPDVHRFVVGVLPSEQDDVITSPYNATLSCSRLCEFADAVMPIDNQALIDQCQTYMQKLQAPANASANSTTPRGGTSRAAAPDAVASTTTKMDQLQLKSSGRAFSEMNVLGAHILCSLTAGMRFEGDLNIDLNEISMNMVPFPRLHFLVPALSPMEAILAHHYHAPSSPDAQLYTLSAAGARSGAGGSGGVGGRSVNNGTIRMGATSTSTTTSTTTPTLFQHTVQAAYDSMNATVTTRSGVIIPARTAIDNMFQDVLGRHNQLIKVDPMSSTYLSLGLLCRGALSVTSLTRCIGRITPHLSFLPYAPQAYKVGLCGTPSPASPFSCLALANTTAMGGRLAALLHKLDRLWRRRAHWHHYAEYMSADDMLYAIDVVHGVQSDYAELVKRGDGASGGGGSSTSGASSSEDMFDEREDSRVAPRRDRPRPRPLSSHAR